MNVKIQRSRNGAVMGAVLWIPGSIIEHHVQVGQDEVEVSFEGDIVRIRGSAAASLMTTAEGLHDSD